MIKYGLMDSLPLPPKLSSKHCIRTRDETKLALETLQDYIQVGAVKDIKPRPGQTFNTLVFNQETGKFKTNYRLQREKSLPGAKTFQVGRLAGKFSFLRKGMWATKVDLKHTDFHLGHLRQRPVIQYFRTPQTSISTQDRPPFLSRSFAPFQIYALTCRNFGQFKYTHQFAPFINVFEFVTKWKVKMSR